MTLNKENILYSFDKIIGKTIKDIYDNYEGQCIISFTDETFIMFYAQAGYHGDADIEIMDDVFSYWYSYSDLLMNSPAILIGPDSEF